MSRRIHKRLYLDHGAYFYVSRVAGKVKWTRLSENYADALRMWADIEGAAAPTDWTVSKMLTHYLAVSKKRLKDATHTGYLENLKQLVPAFGHMPVEDVEISHVYNYVVKRGNVAGNRERALLSAAYAHLIKTGQYKGANPAAGLQFRNPEKPRKRYVDDEEFSKLLAAAGTRMRTLLSFAFATGMRQLDVLNLQITAGAKEGIRYVDSKTGQTHLVAWTDELRTLWRAAAGARVGALPLFLARDGEAYTSSGFRASFRRVAVRAKLENIRFHDLRRKAGSDAADLDHAQELLGHSDAKVTKKHYRAKPVAVAPIAMPSVRQKPKR